MHYGQCSFLRRGFLGCHATFHDIQKNGYKGDYGQCESGVELLRVILSAFVFCIHHSLSFLVV